MELRFSVLFPDGANDAPDPAVIEEKCDFESGVFARSEDVVRFEAEEQ
jgi:hypothetical protein